MRADVKQLLQDLEREARVTPHRGVIHVPQMNSLRQGPINQLGIMARPTSQKNSVLDATPGTGGSTATGWIKPPTPKGGFASFRELLIAVQRVNPKLNYADSYNFARQLLQPGIFAGGVLNGASLQKEFRELEPKPAASR